MVSEDFPKKICVNRPSHTKLENDCSLLFPCYCLLGRILLKEKFDRLNWSDFGHGSLEEP